MISQLQRNFSCHSTFRIGCAFSSCTFLIVKFRFCRQKIIQGNLFVKLRIGRLGVEYIQIIVNGKNIKDILVLFEVSCPGIFDTAFFFVKLEPRLRSVNRVV